MHNLPRPINKGALVITIGFWFLIGVLISWVTPFVLVSCEKMSLVNLPSWYTSLISNGDIEDILLAHFLFGEGVLLLVAVLSLIYQRIRWSDWWGWVPRF